MEQNLILVRTSDPQTLGDLTISAGGEHQDLVCRTYLNAPKEDFICRRKEGFIAIEPELSSAWEEPQEFWN